jgi:hypothetical protein
MIIKLDTSNDAFAGDHYHHEIARILRDLANKIEGGEIPLSLRDLNGNTCGVVDMLNTYRLATYNALSAGLPLKRFR